MSGTRVETPLAVSLLEEEVTWALVYGTAEYLIVILTNISYSRKTPDPHSP